KNDVFQKLASRIHTAEEGRSIVVFNPLPWTVCAPVEVPETAKRFLGDRVRVVDDSDKSVPVQGVTRRRVGSVDLAFLAEVPGLGYRTYRALADLSEDSVANTFDDGGVLCADLNRLENDFWRIRLDPYSGDITSLLDKKANVEILERGLSLCVMVDHSDTWAHDLVEWRVEDGRFRVKSARVLELGACRAALCVESEFGNSTARILLTVYRDIPDIYVDAHIHWRERYRVLKLAFDTNIQDGTATYDIPYGCIERKKTGCEEPGQSWIDLTGTAHTKDGNDIAYGFAVINDSKFGYDILDRCMRITLLRSPAYAHHEPARVKSTDPLRYLDQGEQTIRFRLVPHASSWQDAHIPRAAWELNEPLWVHQESAHKGDLPQTASFAECDTEHFVLTVVKFAEDKNDIILRGYESEGKAGTVKIRFPHWGREVSFAVTPHEIKTARISPKCESTDVTETDLLEDKIV
ncbi:MAG: glycoside hydrolase family 38 C-terminal domain-containing protein, partial [bacterium]